MPLPSRVVVAAATYRRPEALAALLPALQEQVRAASAVLGPTCALELLVVDNDPAASARAAVEAAARGAEVPLRYAHEPRPGIGHARNRLLSEAAGADVLVLLDDDELPRPGWLTGLLTTAARHGAAAVAGPVHPVFPAGEDPWIAAGGAARREERPGLATGTVLRRAATNNLLLDLRFLARHGLRFDPALGLTGGEDSLLTGRITAAGGRIVWCAEAGVEETVTPQRNTRAFHLARRRAQSATHVLVDGLLAPDRASWARRRLRWALIGVRQLAAGTLQALAGKVRGSLAQRARGEIRQASALGVLAGCLGLVAVPYARSGRRWRRAPRRGPARP